LQYVSSTSPYSSFETCARDEIERLANGVDEMDAVDVDMRSSDRIRSFGIRLNAVDNASAAVALGETVVTLR